MQAPADPIPARRIFLCVVTSLWLAGHWFFPEGYSHLKLFWCLVAPLALLNAPTLPRLRRPQPWLLLLLVLLLWQALVSSRHPGAWCQPGGWADALAVLVFVIALQAMADTSGAWPALRWTLFGTAALTMVWSLLHFYALSGVALAARRFRNVLVYDDGLNPVLTGLLAGFAMLAGMTLDSPGASRARRVTLWTGIAILAFSMTAAQSRGALLAATAGVSILVWRERRRAIAALASAAAGILAYLAAFASGWGQTVPDLVSRGSSGRIEIYKAHLHRLDGLDWWIGEGRAEAFPENVLGWLVHHPHSSLITQLVHTGLPGLLLLLALLAWTMRAGIRGGGPATAALALLVFGCTGLLYDGAQIASLFSVPRIESLLVLVPAVFAAASAPASPIVRSAQGPP